jgi:hypothetical protein
MFIKQSSFLKLASTTSMLVLTAACAAPPQVPVVADRVSATQSANNGVEFCDLQVTDFTPALVASIRSNPNYDRNLAIWLEQCPELALAFADFGTAAIDETASGFVAGPGEGPDIEGAGSAVPGGGNGGGGDNGNGDGGGDGGNGDDDDDNGDGGDGGNGDDDDDNGDGGDGGNGDDDDDNGDGGDGGNGDDDDNGDGDDHQNGSQSGLGDGTNPGQGSNNNNAGNSSGGTGTNNPGQGTPGQG